VRLTEYQIRKLIRESIQEGSPVSIYTGFTPDVAAEWQRCKLTIPRRWAGAQGAASLMALTAELLGIGHHPICNLISNAVTGIFGGAVVSGTAGGTSSGKGKTPGVSVTIGSNNKFEASFFVKLGGSSCTDDSAEKAKLDYNGFKSKINSTTMKKSTLIKYCKKHGIKLDIQGNFTINQAFTKNLILDINNLILNYATADPEISKCNNSIWVAHLNSLKRSGY